MANEVLSPLSTPAPQPASVNQSDLPAAADAPLNLKKILVPTDFSESSRKALRYAMRLAQQFNAGLTFLHVFQSPEYAYDYMAVQDMASYVLTVQQETHARLTRLSQDVAQSTGLHTEAVFCPGSAYDQISQVAKEREIDLIVISTHGYTGFKHLMLGSNAERVVRYAPCPVLVVREHEREFI